MYAIRSYYGRIGRVHVAARHEQPLERLVDDAQAGVAAVVEDLRGDPGGAGGHAAQQPCLSRDLKVGLVSHLCVAHNSVRRIGSLERAGTEAQSRPGQNHSYNFV